MSWLEYIAPTLALLTALFFILRYLIKHETYPLDKKAGTLDTKVISLDAKVTSLDTKVTSLDAKVTSLDTRMYSLDTKVTSLDTKVTSLDTKVTSLDTRMYSLDTLISSVDRKLETLLRLSFKDSVSKAHSPIGLSDFGIKIAEKSNADVLIEKYAQNVEVTADMNEYTIQQKCFHYGQIKLINDLSTEEREVVEATAFNEGVEVSSIMYAIAIKLRDYKINILGKNSGDIEHAPGESHS